MAVSALQRLHWSAATLPQGLLWSVPLATPIILCILNPSLAEMCHIEVEFEEDVDVLFSVIGPGSVHLSGYYLRRSTSIINIARDQPSSDNGEYLGEFDTESSYKSEEDRYESGFIDDGDVQVSEGTYVPDSMDVGDVCSSPDHHKAAFEKHSKPIRNWYSRSTPHRSNEDEGSFTSGEIMESLRNDARKRKREAMNHDPSAPTEVAGPSGSSIPEPELGKQKKSKEIPLEAEDGKHSSNIRTLEDGLTIEDLSAGNRDAKVASVGNKVYINYAMKLQGGNIVHSNAGQKPYLLVLGAEKMILGGWVRGIIDMRVGGKRRVTVPPTLCRITGAKSHPAVIYEVELVEVR